MEERCSVWRRADTAGTGAFTSGDVSQLDGVNNGCFFFLFGAWLSPCLAKEYQRVEIIVDIKASVMSILVHGPLKNFGFPT